MKKLTAIILAAALLFCLTACDGGTKDNALKDITLCLDWTPNTNHTGFYVALAKGYYEELGINLTIVQPPEDGADLMVASGQAQFGISAQDSLAAAYSSENPIAVTAVATLINHNTSGIISRKGEGCDTPKGLEGKTYSTWNSPVEQAIIESVMAKDGASFDKVNLIPNVVTDEAAALKNGDTDAIWIYYAWGGINAELTGLAFDYFAFEDINPVFDFYTPVITANNTFLESDPDTAKAFLSATEKGYNYAIENPEEAAQILIDGDTTGSLKGSEELVLASQKWINEQYIADAESWGYIDSERWDGFYKWLADEGLIEKEIPSGFGFTNEFLV